MARSKELPQFPESTPLPGYTDCFQQANRDFARAGKIWLSYRLGPLFLTANKLDDRQAQENIENVCVKAVTTQFGPDTLTDHALTKILPFLERFPFVIFSQGNPAVQRAKIEGFSQVSGLPITEENIITEEDKFTLTEQISAKLLREGLKSNRLLPHILLIEDKITNVLRLLLRIEGNHTTTVPKEEELDKEDFDFTGFKEQWLTFFKEHSYIFNPITYLYIPPDKPTGTDPVLHKSALREKRIKDLIASTNSLYQERFGDSREQDSGPFFHLDEYYKVDSALPPHTFVVCDYDGPLGSQNRTLTSRDPLITAITEKAVGSEYSRIFGLTAQNMHAFLNNPQVRDLYIDKEGGISATLPDRSSLIISKIAQPIAGPPIYDLRIDDRRGIIRKRPFVIPIKNVNLNDFNQVYASLFAQDNPLISAPEDNNS